jgi:Ca2+-binding EF-hand superfamily protein
MLTGGTADKNLMPLTRESEDACDQLMSRVRSLLVFSVEHQGPRIDPRSGLRKADVMMERWKALFSKYDVEGSGTLTLQNIRHMVRSDLKIAERILTDNHIRILFGMLDTDASGAIDFFEFLDFVQQQSTRGKVSDKDVLNSVSRAVRLAVMKNKIRAKDLETMFHVGEIATGPTGDLRCEEMVRFFTKALKLTKDKVTDKAFQVVFNTLDEDSSGKISLDVLLDFVKSCTTEPSEKEKPVRVQGLIAGMRGVMLDHKPSRRPGIDGVVPQSPKSSLPFCLTGRGNAARYRLASTSKPFLNISEPALTLPSISKPNLSQNMFKAASAPNLRDVTEIDISDDDAPTSPGMITEKSCPVAGSPQKGPKSGKPLKKATGSYAVLKGGKCLNQVEDRLFAAGIDVRGRYHRLQTKEYTGEASKSRFGDAKDLRSRFLPLL